MSEELRELLEAARRARREATLGPLHLRGGRFAPEPTSPVDAVLEQALNLADVARGYATYHLERWYGGDPERRVIGAWAVIEQCSALDAQLRDLIEHTARHRAAAVEELLRARVLAGGGRVQLHAATCTRGLIVREEAVCAVCGGEDIDVSPLPRP